MTECFLASMLQVFLSINETYWFSHALHLSLWLRLLESKWRQARTPIMQPCFLCYFCTGHSIDFFTHRVAADKLTKHGMNVRSLSLIEFLNPGMFPFWLAQGLSKLPIMGFTISSRTDNVLKTLQTDRNSIHSSIKEDKYQASGHRTSSELKQTTLPCGIQR